MRALGVSAVLIAALGAAAAQPTPPPQQTPQQQQADQLFTEGRELVKQENYKGACEKFEAAIALDPTAPGVMLNLGLCNEKLGKIATSLKWYRKAQIAASESGLADYEAAAKERTAELTTKVSILKIDLGASPANTDVRIDGTKLEPTDFTKLELDAGSHTIEATAEGKKAFRETFEVKQGENRTITVALGELETKTVYVDRGKGRRLAGIVIGSAGVAAMAVSGIYAWRVSSDWNEAPTSPDKEKETRSKLDIGTGIFFGGVALVATGVVLYLTAPGKEARQETMTFTPVVGPDRAGFAYTRSF